jgi:hypothetical protein
MAKQSTGNIHCTRCGEKTSISHYLKYFTNKEGKTILGGVDIEGPLCMNCFCDINDLALGKPKILVKEHEFVKTNLGKRR